MAQSIFVKELLAGVGPHRAAAPRRTHSTSRYALDPTLPLLEGHVKVWNKWKVAFEPFEPWEHQLETVRTWIDVDRLKAEGVCRFHNTHVEKSRQMGDTVIFAYACLWVVTYHDAPLLMQHVNLAEVSDAGAESTWDSFFGKIRLMWEQWPSSIGKARLRFKGGGDPMVINLDHPFRFITGDGATADPGRGGAYAGVVVDEAARIAYGEQAHAALSQACPVGRAYLSTPEGEGNMYFRIKRDRPAGWRFVRHHWSEHPLYGAGAHVAGEDPDCVMCEGNRRDLRWDSHDPQCHRYPGKLTSEWYDQAVVELTDEQVAAELDIDYTASLAARVYPEFTEELHVHPEPIPLDPQLPLSTAWDYGLDTTACIVMQEASSELRIIGEWEGHDLTPAENARGVIDVLRLLGHEERLLARFWTSKIESIGDPAGDARELGTARPLTDEYRAAGFNIHSPQQMPVARTILSVKRLLKLGRPKRIVVSPTCWRFIEHAKANVWPTDRQGVRKPGVTQPLDNEHNHMMRALAYYCAYKWPAPEKPRLPTPDEPMWTDKTGRADPGISYDMKF